jgi:hypothetical protein
VRFRARGLFVETTYASMNSQLNQWKSNMCLAFRVSFYWFTSFCAHVIISF